MGIIVQSDTGLVSIAEAFRVYLQTLDVRIYVTDIALDATTMPVVIADEPTDGGYTPSTLPYPNPFTFSVNKAIAVGETFTFIFSLDMGDFFIYGIFLTDPADSDSTVFACPADAPIHITAPGQIFQTTLGFVYDDEEADS